MAPNWYWALLLMYEHITSCCTDTVLLTILQDEPRFGGYPFDSYFFTYSRLWNRPKFFVCSLTPAFISFWYTFYLPPLLYNFCSNLRHCHIPHVENYLSLPSCFMRLIGSVANSSLSSALLVCIACTECIDAGCFYRFLYLVWSLSVCMSLSVSLSAYWSQVLWSPQNSWNNRDFIWD